MNKPRTPAQPLRTRLDDLGFGACLTALAVAVVGFLLISAIGDEASMQWQAMSAGQPVTAVAG